MTRRRILSCSAVIILTLLAPATLRGFATYSPRQTWANGTVTMQMQLGPGSGGLQDGTTSWNQAASQALNIWNQYIDLVKFAAVQDSTAARGQNNGVNNVFFDSTWYGRTFGPDHAAQTVTFIVTGNVVVEADVIFNTAFQWNSYRGPGQLAGGSRVLDMRRFALHEFGHVLGLNHPDESGQSVSALMNSSIGNLDTLTDDDIAGGRSLYSAGVQSNVSFPPRNEPNDFFAQLIGVYRDELRAASVPTYIDPEGAVVWLSEYARYRVGLCDHASATSRVFSQIDNTGVYGVCALTPAGPIPFPPRNEGLDFMNQLDAKYRDALRRGVTSSFVNNEGAVVWVLEYFRYRLNRCNHGDAVTKVFQQIRGQGIQPTCQ